MLKWAGGKGRLLEQYTPHFPRSYGAYFEPFVGSAAVFFHLESVPGHRRVRLSDTNAELINLYRILQSDVESLIAALHVHALRHGQEHFYAVRSWQASQLSSAEQAARTIYLNRTCFNGLYRVNSKGQFNVPMGRYSNPVILSESRLRQAHRALQGVELAVAGFESVLAEAAGGDLVYFDPPYQPLTRTASFTAYTKDSFGEAQQARLAEVFRELDQRGVKLLLSNSDTPLIHDLYAGYRILPMRVGRCINSRADRRTAITEVLVTNQSPTCGRRRG